MRFVIIDRYHIVWLEVECRCTLHSGYDDRHMQVQSVVVQEKKISFGILISIFTYII
jgi:hypothetical protein